MRTECTLVICRVILRRMAASACQRNGQLRFLTQSKSALRSLYSAVRLGTVTTPDSRNALGLHASARLRVNTLRLHLLTLRGIDCRPLTPTRFAVESPIGLRERSLLFGSECFSNATRCLSIWSRQYS